MGSPYIHDISCTDCCTQSCFCLKVETILTIEPGSGRSRAFFYVSTFLRAPSTAAHIHHGEKPVAARIAPPFDPTERTDSLSLLTLQKRNERRRETRIPA